MFNFSNTFFVGPSLFSFLPSMALAECRCSVCLCKRIENSDVEVSLLAISSPEVCCNNIEAGAFFSVGCSVAQLLSDDWSRRATALQNSQPRRRRPPRCCCNKLLGKRSPTSLFRHQSFQSFCTNTQNIYTQPMP